MNDDDLSIGQHVLVVLPPAGRKVQSTTIDGKQSISSLFSAEGRLSWWARIASDRGFYTCYHTEAFTSDREWCTRRCLMPLDPDEDTFIEEELEAEYSGFMP